MTKKSELYKCNICGNLVEVIKSGEGELVCCGEAMELIKPQIHEDEKTASYGKRALYRICRSLYKR